MAIKRKICVVTGTRAEYGLLFWLMKEIDASEILELQVVVTGMHLSPEFGLTYEQIVADGFEIDRKIEMLLSSDTVTGITKSVGLGMVGFADAFAELEPDLVLVLGDRFEVFATASAAMLARIPIAHLHGGEATEGLIDEPIRHSITKMSQLHFTSTEEYRNRIIQLGEQPNRIFNVGAAGLDNITRLELLSKRDLELRLDFNLGKKNLLVTYHPVTLEDNTSEKQFIELLAALDELNDTHIIFTKPNSDADGRVVINLIDDYVQRHSGKSAAYVSLGQLRYLSTLQYVDAVVGNSSSGLLEAPSFNIGTVNVGDRQRGRVKATSVIDCEPERVSISMAFKRLYSNEFQSALQDVDNPYFKSDVATNIIKVLESFPLDGILKKQFYDIPVTS